MRTGGRYLVCPDCGHKGVSLRLRSNGEDHYGCRYCGWYVWTLPDTEWEQVQRQRLADANPGREGEM